MIRALLARTGGAIGIDLGGRDLTAVQLAGDGRSIAAAVRCPRRLGRDACADEIPRFVRILARRGVRPGPVVIGLPDERVTVAELTLPGAAAHAVVREMVATQLARMRPAATEALVCGWWSTDEGTAAARRSLACGTSEADAEAIARACDACGLDLAAIVPRPLAVAQACSRRALGRLEIVLDRSGPTTIATVLDNGRVSYVRPIAPDAEHGPDEHAPTGHGREAFLRELRLTLGYLVHRHPAASIRRLLLLGEPGDVTALLRLVPESIGLPAEALELPEGSTEDRVSGDGRLLVAYGLALDGGGGA